MLAYLPPEMETPFILIVPVIAIAGLLALPFLAGEGEKSWHRRPVAVLTVSTIAVCWGVLTHLGTTTPWSPHMNAWSGDPVPVRYLQTARHWCGRARLSSRPSNAAIATPSAESGGERGPALDDVATRMTIDQMRFKVVTGGGNMPAYGKNLSPAEIEALVAFLETLHPANEPPAYDASRRASRTPPIAPADAAHRSSVNGKPSVRVHDRHDHSRGPLHDGTFPGS